jgi:hypothetical protein
LKKGIGGEKIESGKIETKEKTKDVDFWNLTFLDGMELMFRLFEGPIEDICTKYEDPGSCATYDLLEDVIKARLDIMDNEGYLKERTTQIIEKYNIGILDKKY